MDIGAALTTTRKNKGYRQTEAAKEADISQTYLSQIENNQKTPSIEVLEKLSKIYKTPFPVMMWFSITEKDVKKDKLVIFNKLKPSIDNLINDIFN